MFFFIPWGWGVRELGSAGSGVAGSVASGAMGSEGQGPGEAADGVAFAVLWLFTSSLSHYLFNSGGGLIK